MKGQFIIYSSNMDGTNWFEGNWLDLFLAQTSPNGPEVSRDQLPDLEILMVVAVPGVVNSLGYLQPSKEEDELEDEKDRDADVGDVGDLLLGEKSHSKVGIHSKLYNLKKKTSPQAKRHKPSLLFTSV